MKRLILNMLVVLFVVAALLLSGGHISWAGQVADCQFSYLTEEPNEPGPESWSFDSQIVYLAEDPNEPGAE